MSSLKCKKKKNQHKPFNVNYKLPLNVYHFFASFTLRYIADRLKEDTNVLLQNITLFFFIVIL